MQHDALHCSLFRLEAQGDNMLETSQDSTSCTAQDCEALQLANADRDRFAFCGVEAVLGGTVDATAALQPPDAVGTATPLSGESVQLCQ